MMQTLYDQLGVCPKDDKDRIKQAFRDAIKANHPDIVRNDPMAPVRFRQIVRAHSILSDPELRADYDSMLARERQLAEASAKGSVISDAVAKIKADAIAIAFLVVVMLGGYAVFVYVSKTSDAAGSAARAPAPQLATAVVPGLTDARSDGSRKASPRTAERGEVSHEALAPSVVVVMSTAGDDAGAAATPAGSAARAPAPQLATAIGDGPRHASTDASRGVAINAPPGTVERGEVPHEAVGRAVVMTTAGDGAVAEAVPAETATRDEVIAAVSPAPEPAPAPGPRTASFYRERGLLAYRAGDFDRAIADLDLAISLDPNFEAAYVDRGIVLYRIGQFERAFADVAQAKRIASSSRTRPQAKTVSSSKP
jgi:hypothetical protein